MTSTPRLDRPDRGRRRACRADSSRLYDLVAASTEAVGRDQAAARSGSAASWRHSISIVSWPPGSSRPNSVGAAGGPVLAPGGPPSSIAAPHARSRSRSPHAATSAPPTSWRPPSSGFPRGRGSKRPLEPRVNAATSIGSEARRRAGRRLGRTRARAALLEVLRGAGYEPDVDADGTVCLRNCPYDALVADHRDMTCGMNLAWAEGVIDGLRVPGVRAELAPEPGRCCVVLRAETG